MAIPQYNRYNSLVMAIPQYNRYNSLVSIASLKQIDPSLPVKYYGINPFPPSTL
jgi:hypothetical protein